MPWKIVAGGKGCPFEVVRTDTGKYVACHPARAKAEAHLRNAAGLSSGRRHRGVLGAWRADRLCTEGREHQVKQDHCQ
jgi:hypothetical protein